MTSIVVIGDSMADWLAYGLEQAYADSPDIGVVRKNRTYSGLIHNETKVDPRGLYPDWPQLARETLNTEKANFVVVMLGINDRQQLAAAESVFQTRLKAAAMQGGVTFLDPSRVTLSHDTQFGRDVLVEPDVFFGPGVKVGDGVTIRAFSHLVGADIGPNSIIGPFARLRPGASIGEGAHIDNFVEVKNTVIEKGAKANHLTYLGDARVGEGANIGAGTITCNYDGFDKHHTDIGAGAFIGSNTALVAPIRVGDGAITGAGSTITKDVGKDALAVERTHQKQLGGWAERFRARKKSEKAKRGSK